MSAEPGHGRPTSEGRPDESTPRFRFRCRHGQSEEPDVGELDPAAAQDFVRRTATHREPESRRAPEASHSAPVTTDDDAATRVIQDALQVGRTDSEVSATAENGNAKTGIAETGSRVADVHPLTADRDDHDPTLREAERILHEAETARRRAEREADELRTAVAEERVRRADAEARVAELEAALAAAGAPEPVTSEGAEEAQELATGVAQTPPDPLNDPLSGPWVDPIAPPPANDQVDEEQEPDAQPHEPAATVPEPPVDAVPEPPPDDTSADTHDASPATEEPAAADEDAPTAVPPDRTIGFRSEQGISPAAIATGALAVVGAVLVLLLIISGELLSGVGIPLCVATVLLGIVAVRMMAVTNSVVVDDGVLELSYGGSQHTFYLTSRNTRVETQGRPGDRDWKFRVLRRGMDPLVIDAKMVDPQRFLDCVRQWRPEL